MVDFGGWDMPVQYPAGTVEEHLRTRTHAGLFDVSHMGEIDVRGPEAISFINRLVSNDVTKLVDGQAQYSALTTPEGTVVDDLLVYRFGPEHLLLVVNAGTPVKDWEWIRSHHVHEMVEMKNVSDEYCQIALQGPDALGILQKLTTTPLEEIRYYHFREGEVDGVPAIISRTGYTGEDGFEVYVPADRAAALWRRLLGVGAEDGLAPCGLGSRDSLRLEMGMALYGNDLDEDHTPLEAGLAWVTKLAKGDFVGRDALAAQKEAGVQRKLVGFRLKERGFPRPHYTVTFEGRTVGEVTSGTMSPTLGEGIGMAYVSA